MEGMEGMESGGGWSGVGEETASRIVTMRDWELRFGGHGHDHLWGD